MARKKNLLPPKLQVWVDARKQFRLSHAHIQMARELGLNPKKLGSIANHDQERWKSPLPIFIEDLYFERFGMERPEVILTIEQLFKNKKAKDLQKKQKKEQVKEQELSESEDNDEFYNPF